MSTNNRRGGLGRGLGALIPTAPRDGSAAPHSSRPAPTDSVFFGAQPADQLASEKARSGRSRADAATKPPHQASAEVSRNTGDEAADVGLLPVAGATFAELPVDEIHPNAKQPRQVFDADALAELVHSVREFGILQPIVVRADESDQGGYELVMGERRLRAAIAAGLQTIPAIIRSTADDAMLRDALLENIHRVQLNPLEEAAAYQQLLEEFGTTHDELAQRIGRSRPQVSNTIRLLNLSVPVQRRVAAGVLSAGHARALLGMEDQDAQDELASRIVAEGLSVRATEELVALHSSGHAEKKRSKRTTASRISAPALGELADKLSDRFDTRVRVELGRRKGKITVEFASVDDLERIVAVMAPKLSSRVVADHAEPNMP